MLSVAPLLGIMGDHLGSCLRNEWLSPSSNPIRVSATMRPPTGPSVTGIQHDVLVVPAHHALDVAGFFPNIMACGLIMVSSSGR
jgi:hypothetical protein